MRMTSRMRALPWSVETEIAVLSIIEMIPATYLMVGACSRQIKEVP